MPFFATKCKLGKEGVEEVSPIGDITAYEQGWLDKLKPELKAQIDKGISFIVDAPQNI
jgi:malate dehydrogenase